MRDGGRLGRRQAERFLQQGSTAAAPSRGRAAPARPSPCARGRPAWSCPRGRSGRVEPRSRAEPHAARAGRRPGRARPRAAVVLNAATPASMPGISSAPKNGQAYPSVGSPTKAGTGRATAAVTRASAAPRSRARGRGLRPRAAESERRSARPRPRRCCPTLRRACVSERRRDRTAPADGARAARRPRLLLTTPASRDRTVCRIGARLGGVTPAAVSAPSPPGTGSSPAPTSSLPTTASAGLDRRGDPAAEVAKATLYRHFASKDVLVLAFLQQREQLWTGVGRGGGARRGETAEEHLLATLRSLRRVVPARGLRGLLVHERAARDERPHHFCRLRQRGAPGEHPLDHPAARNREDEPGDPEQF